MYPLESVVGGVAHILAHGDSVPQGQTPNRSGVRATSARRLGGKGSAEQSAREAALTERVLHQCARTSVRRRRWPLCVLGTDTHAIPDPTRRPGGPDAGGDGRSPMRASHLHFMVTAPGYRTLVTHIFVRGEELLDSDTVFGVMDSLIKDFVAQPPGTPAPNGRDLSRVVRGIRL